MKKRRKKVNMLDGNLLENIILFALPVIASGIMQLLFNAIDMVVVGKFSGNNSMAAVSSTGALINLVVNMFIGLSIGSSVCIARRIGSGNNKKVHDAVQTSVTIALFAANKRIDRGFSADFLGVSENGAVEQDTVKNAINDNTAMASFMLVNNETGAVTDIAPISVLCREKGVALHVDATQALGKLDVNVDTIDCDFLSASAHKLYGPKGVGCAYIRSDKYGLPPITSLLHGGEQEFGIRGGTLAVHNIVGFGKAAEIATRDMEKNEKLICELDEYLIAGLSQIHDVLPLIDPRSRVKGIISLLVKRRNFNNERFIKRVSSEVAISTGSACSAGEPSHVIAAIGQKENVSKIIRVSLNKYTTKSNIDCLIRLLTK